jgi:hypothetical protein
MSHFYLDLTILPTPINVGLNIAPLALRVDPLDIKIEPLDIKIHPLDIKVEPLDMSFRLKEIPSVRAHFPVDYGVCVALFGVELLSVRLCGQAQVITEPYVPNPCECSPRLRLVTDLVAPTGAAPK